MSDLVPVTLLTGFLGAGKTSLLNRLIADPQLSDALVLINEFGEIGLDHDLVQAVSGEMLVMASGCLCCTIKADLVRELATRYLERKRGAIAFGRVVIETTGLADPAPILHALMGDALLAQSYRLDGVVTVVDAVTGAASLDQQPEAAKQAAVADRIVLTKTDLADPATTDALIARLKRLNPAAPILTPVEAGPDQLFNVGLYNPATKHIDVAGWLAAEAYAHDHHHHHHDVNRHDARITATCITLTEPVQWDAFALWAEGLAMHRGDQVLRLKAIIHAVGEDQPIAVHGVQHLYHPPARLPAGTAPSGVSRIVVIARDLDPTAIRQSLTDALAAAR
jgi:G3E family GTPase